MVVSRRLSARLKLCSLARRKHDPQCSPLNRLKSSSFICKCFGGRPNIGMLRYMLRIALQGFDAKNPNSQCHGLGFYFHTELEPQSDIQAILIASLLELKYGKGTLLQWFTSFSAVKEKQMVRKSQDHICIFSKFGKTAAATDSCTLQQNRTSMPTQEIPCNKTSSKKWLRW